MAEVNLLENDTIARHLGNAIRDGGHGLNTVPALLKIILVNDMWQERVIHETGETVKARTFVEFVTRQPLEGLGADIKTLQKLCEAQGDVETIALLDDAVKRPVGTNQHTREGINNVNTLPMGNSRDRALRDLRAKRPDLHADVISKKKSPHAAMIEAGFRVKTITLPLELGKAAKTIRRHFERSDIEALIRLLQDDNEQG